MGKQIAELTRFTGRRTRIKERLMPDTCTIYPPLRVVDSAGSYSNGRGTAVTYEGSSDIPCRLDVTRYYRQAEIFGQEAIVSDYEIHVPHDVTLQQDYEIVIGNGTYQVRKLLHDDDVWRPVRSALVSRVGQGSDD